MAGKVARNGVLGIHSGYGACLRTWCGNSAGGKEALKGMEDMVEEKLGR